MGALGGVAVCGGERDADRSRGGEKPAKKKCVGAS